MTAARAAAAWWAKAVGSPRFDNGDDSDTGQMASLMALLVVANERTDGDAFDRFEAALWPMIQAQLERSNFGVSIGVDYGPDRILADAAAAAGLSTSRFPWKTNMRVTPDCVTVSAGYRAPTVLVWFDEAWERPACESQAYDEKTGDYLPGRCSLPKFHEEPHNAVTPSPLCTECRKPEDSWTHGSAEAYGADHVHVFVGGAA